MSKKVLQLNNLLNGDKDALADALSQQYVRWRGQRQGWESEKKELRNYIFATSTRTTTNSSLPWRNNTTIPKICQIRDNLHANYLDALFPNDDWLIWEGDDQESVAKEKRRIIEMYIKNKAKKSGFREEIAKCINDYIDYGIALGEVVWVNESHYDPELDKDVVSYMGPKFMRVSPWDHYFNPTATHYNKTSKFTRILKNIGELKKEIKTRPDLLFDEAAFQKIVDRRRSIHAFSWEDVNKLVLLPHRDMFLNTGVNEVFSNQYSILSWFIHPSYVSVLQFGQMFEKEFNEEHTYTFLRISRIIMSMLIVDYCKYFSVAMEEFGKLSKVDQLIIYADNKTYRSNHDFSTDAFKDLEKEIVELLKKRKKKD